MSKVVKEVVSDKFTGEVTVEYSDDSTNKFNIADTVVAVTNSGNTSVTKLQANNIDLAVFTPEEKSKVVMAETNPVTGGISLSTAGQSIGAGNMTLPRQAMITVSCGNSIAAQSQKGYAGSSGWGPSAEIQWANALAGSPMRFAFMTATTRADLYGAYGYSGQTLDTINGDLDSQWYSQFTTAGVTPELFVGLALLENDIAQGATYAQMVSRLKRWIYNVRRYPGAIILLCTPRPSYSNNTPAIVSAYQQITDYMESLDDGKSIFVARLNGYENPASPGVPIAGYTDASVHPNTRGAMRNARAIAGTLRRIVSISQQPYRLLSNNYGLVGSSAASGTNVTGTVPTGCTVIGSANAAFVSTAENPGFLVAISQQSGANADVGSIVTSAVSYAGGASSQVSLYADIEIVSGAENLRWMSLEPRIQDGGGNTFRYHLAPQTAAEHCEFRDGDILTFVSPPVKANSGNIISATVYIRPYMKTDYAGTVTVTGTVVFRVRQTGIGAVVA